MRDRPWRRRAGFTTVPPVPDMVIPRFAAGILAGGRSQRMGRDKALLDAGGGKPMLRRQLEILAPIAAELLIASGSRRRYEEFGARVVTDTLSPGCALAGVHALLTSAGCDIVFVCACDQPYLNASLVLHLVGRLGDNVAVVPVGRRGIEPLHAVYTRACLGAIEEAFRDGQLSVSGLPDRCRAARVEVRDDDWLVLGASPFTNINAPGDYLEFLRKVTAAGISPGTGP